MSLGVDPRLIRETPKAFETGRERGLQKKRAGAVETFKAYSDPLNIAIKIKDQDAVNTIVGKMKEDPELVNFLGEDFSYDVNEGDLDLQTESLVNNRLQGAAESTADRNQKPVMWKDTKGVQRIANPKETGDRGFYAMQGALNTEILRVKNYTGNENIEEVYLKLYNARNAKRALKDFRGTPAERAKLLELTDGLMIGLEKALRENYKGMSIGGINPSITTRAEIIQAGYKDGKSMSQINKELNDLNKGNK